MYIHIIDRSKLDEVICVYPKGHSKYPEGRQVTRREELMNAKGYYFGRKDVVLVNGTRSGEEYTLEVGTQRNTLVGQKWILDILSDEQFAQVKRIMQRMQANVQDEPAAEKLLVPNKYGECADQILISE